MFTKNKIKSTRKIEVFLRVLAIFSFQKIIEFVIKTFPKSRNSVKILHPEQKKRLPKKESIFLNSG
jgi:hypothetical protein